MVADLPDIMYICPSKWMKFTLHSWYSQLIRYLCTQFKAVCSSARAQTTLKNEEDGRRENFFLFHRRWRKMQQKKKGKKRARRYSVPSVERERRRRRARDGFSNGSFSAFWYQARFERPFAHREMRSRRGEKNQGESKPYQMISKVGCLLLALSRFMRRRRDLTL